MLLNMTHQLRRLVPSSVSYGMMMSVISRCLAVALSFLAMAFSARYLGVGAFGTFAVAVAAVTLAVRLVTLGAPELTIRLLASSADSDRRALAQSAVIYGTALSLTITGAVCAIYFFVARTTEMDGDFFLSLLWAFATVLPLSAIAHNLSAVLNGLGKIGEVVWIGEGLRQSFFLLAAGVSLLVGFLDPSPVALIKLTAYSYAALALVLAMRVRSSIRQLTKTRPQERFSPSKWGKTVVAIGMFGILTAAYQQVDVLMIQWLAGSKDVGLYYAAARSANLVTFLLAGLMVPLAPLVAKLYTERGPEQVERLCNGAAKLLLVTCVPITGFFVIAGQAYLAMVFGETFVAAYPALVILSVGLLAKSVLELNQMVFFMCGSVKPIFISNLIGLGMNAAGNLLLVPRFGISGAAVAAACAMIITGIIQWRLAKHLLGVNIIYPRADQAA